jgi:hypothetical protein
MKNITLSIALLTIAQGFTISSFAAAVTKDQVSDNLQIMLDEMTEISGKMQKYFDELPEKIHKNFTKIGQVFAPEIGVEVAQDDHFVILFLTVKGSENLDVGKDIAIDVDDNLLVVQVPMKKGKVAFEVYENRLTVFQSYETKKEEKDKGQFFVASSQSSVQTQLLPSRVDVSNVAAISAEYKEKNQKLILKLPKKLARKIAIKASTVESFDKEK